MMYRIVKTEIWKLKRYHIIWAGILLMLLSVGITLFSSIALDDTVWTFPHLVERVIQNNSGISTCTRSALKIWNKKDRVPENAVFSMRVITS